MSRVIERLYAWIATSGEALASPMPDGGEGVCGAYLPGMPDVEGAVCNPSYNRAGCRTPMQWDDGPNAGFSSADKLSLTAYGRAPKSLYDTCPPPR